MHSAPNPLRCPAVRSVSSVDAASTGSSNGFDARLAAASSRRSNAPSDDCAAASIRIHPRPTRFALAVCASLSFAACTAPARARQAAPDVHQPDRSTDVAHLPSRGESPTIPRDESPPAPAWTRHHALESNARTYLLHIDPPPSAMPDNEPFQIDVWITQGSIQNELCRDVTLAIDAGMPEHGHGMNRVPKVTRAAAGHFVVEGLYFHMTGRWELYFDITRGAVTERAQCDVHLAD